MLNIILIITDHRERNVSDTPKNVWRLYVCKILILHANSDDDGDGDKISAGSHTKTFSELISFALLSVRNLDIAE